MTVLKRLNANVSAVVMGLLLSVLTTGVLASGTSPLHILLTNDDGYEAPGIQALHEALVAAGFRVTVCAPRTQQSGTSMRVSLGAVTIKRIEEGFWTIDGSPADSVSFALQKLLADDPPDLVVSGANFGENLGSNTNLSGTVGAALMAAQLGKPAVAVSVGLLLAEHDKDPRFETTVKTFPAAAAFTVRLINQLVEQGTPLLPPHTILNVNYPARPPSEIRAPVMAPVSRVGGFNARFNDGDKPGELNITLEHGPGTDPETAGSDTEMFANGHITVSALDSHLGAHRRWDGRAVIDALTAP